jgi:citrate lyase subunit alpha/citrate CoA-transferase
MVGSRWQKLPEYIEGYGKVRPYGGQAIPKLVTRSSTLVRPVAPDQSKLLKDIDAALAASELKSGSTISFHHHLRNGDQVLNMVLAAAAKRNIKDLTVAASSLFPVHAPLVEHIRSGVVTRLYTGYMAGPVADAVSHRVLARPVIMQTHGGRARAIEAGELHIDVAFIAAPAADTYGNLNGVEGPAACGTLGYAMADARYADMVVAITDHLVPYPACPIEISQDEVDFVVLVDSIGDPNGILSGTTRPTTESAGLAIAKTAADVVAASGLLKEDFSFQTGAGGVSIAVAGYVGELMRQKNVQGSFAAGGITGALVDMLYDGLFRALFDVQCFDLKAVNSYRRNRHHLPMSASMYGNPCNRGAVVNKLDVMILGAAEIDMDFNVNVTTGASGRILGGSGGHSDTAAGAKLALVTTRLSAAGGRKLVERVGCITTPGETIDVLVTEAGVAVNPRRMDLAERLKEAKVKVVTMGELLDAVSGLNMPVTTSSNSQDIVGVVEYRDGSVMDVIRAAV